MFHKIFSNILISIDTIFEHKKEPVKILMDYNKFELWLHALHRFTCTHKTHNERHCCTMINNTTYHLANICFNANIRSSSNKNNDKTIAMKENQKIPVIWQSNEILFALISITSMILKYLIFKIVSKSNSYSN